MTDTDNTTPETTTAQPISGDPAGPDHVEPSADNGNREAAKYRRALRTTEAHRDALATKVEGYHRAEVTRLAADILTDPADLWNAVELADLLDDHGDLAPDKVTAALDAIAEAHPHWVKVPPSVTRTIQGSGAFGTGTPSGADDWSQIIGRALGNK